MPLGTSQVSTPVQGFASSQSASVAQQPGRDVRVQPIAGRHASRMQTAPSSQTRGAPGRHPISGSQVSVPVHASPSSQELSSGVHPEATSGLEAEAVGMDWAARANIATTHAATKTPRAALVTLPRKGVRSASGKPHTWGSGRHSWRGQHIGRMKRKNLEELISRADDCLLVAWAHQQSSRQDKSLPFIRIDVSGESAHSDKSHLEACASAFRDRRSSASHGRERRLRTASRRCGRRGFRSASEPCRSRSA
jgi:hypothetical protein